MRLVLLVMLVGCTSDPDAHAHRKSWATCGVWTPYTANNSPIGCTRAPNRPATEHITMTHDEELAEGTLPNPLQVSIGGKLLGAAVTSTVTATCL